MSDGIKPTEVKGMLKKKRDQPVSVEEMNETIREKGANAMDGLESWNITDLPNDGEGGDIESDHLRFKDHHKLHKS